MPTPYLDAAVADPITAFLLDAAFARIAAPVAPPAASLKWDAATKSAHMNVSADGLTLSASYSGGATCRASLPRNSGKLAVQCVGVFDASLNAQAAQFGLVPGDWLNDEARWVNQPGYAISWFGYTTHDAADDTYLFDAQPSGSGIVMLANFDAGEVRFFPANAVSANPDSVPAHWTFPPGTELFVGGMCFGNDAALNGSLSIVPGYSVADYAAWSA